MNLLRSLNSSSGLNPLTGDHVFRILHTQPHFCVHLSTRHHLQYYDAQNAAIDAGVASSVDMWAHEGW